MFQKYRVMERVSESDETLITIADALTEEEATETLYQYITSHPDQVFFMEKYDWQPDSSRLGRDPDLH